MPVKYFSAFALMNARDLHLCSLLSTNSVSAQYNYYTLVLYAYERFFKCIRPEIHMVLRELG